MRWFLFSVLLLTSVGCRQSVTAMDPFSSYGPAIIPPPPTGTAGRSDPYYRRALSSNTNPTGTPNGQTLFTSDQNPSQVGVADQRGAATNPTQRTGNVQWRTPEASNVVRPVEPAGSSQPRPQLGDRRLGEVQPAVGQETQFVGTSPQAQGADRLLSPTPRTSPVVAPATFQQPALPATQPPLPAGAQPTMPSQRRY